MDMVRKGFGNETLKDLTMERKKVEEFEESLQIPQLSSYPLLNSWEVFYQNLFSPYPLLWEGCLVFWEAVKKEPIYIGWCYGQVAESEKLEKK